MDRRRLFVAAWPSAEAVDALAGLERPERAGLRWTRRDQWHVTLRFLGSLAPEEERAVRSGLGAVDWGSLAPAQVTAGPRPTAIGRTAWALPVTGLDEAARAVNAAVDQAGFDRPGGESSRPFNAHLTLARAKKPAALRHLPAPDFSIAWVVTEVTLVCSTLDPEAARYEIVGRWALGR